MNMLIADTSKFDMLNKLDSIKNSVDSIIISMGGQRIFEQTELDLKANDLTAFWIAFIAMVAGILAAVFGYLGYWSQRKTMFNTDKISMTVQKSRFRDIIRHLYRNLICTLAMTDKYLEVKQSSGGLCYPSEEHLLKLKFLPDDVVHLEKYLNNEEVSAEMHKFMLQSRNYSTEIDVAINHLKDPKMPDAVTKRDLGVLAFKPALLTQSVLKVEAEVDATDKHYKDEDYEYLLMRTILTYLDSHITNVKSKLDNAKVDAYRYTDFFSDKTCKFQKKYCEMLEGYSTIPRSYVLDFFASKNDNYYIEYLTAGDRLSKLWDMTSEQNFKGLLLADEIDIKSLLSIIISVDVFLELEIINIIAFE